MESTDQYGWAADDPRWTDAQAAGRGRLEPSPPPRFGADDAEPSSPPSDPAAGLTAAVADTTVDGTAPSAATTPAAVPPPYAPDPTPTPDPADGPIDAAPLGPPPRGVAAVRPVELPLWPPAPSIPEQRAPEPASTRDESPPPPPLPSRFGPPLAIAATTSRTPPLPTRSDRFGPPPIPKAFGPTPAPSPAAAPSLPPIPASVPFSLHSHLGERESRPADPAPRPAGEPLRTGYGLGEAAAGATAANGTGLARRDRTTRLDRRVQIRSRRWADDEFRRAGRAELFSDDARYQVLFALTAVWYAPIALVFLVWVLLVSRDGNASSVLSGLLWLAAAAVLSLVVSGLLRWASVGWRAITLSLAAAIIGGGLTTIAYTLTG